MWDHVRSAEKKQKKNLYDSMTHCWFGPISMGSIFRDLEWWNAEGKSENQSIAKQLRKWKQPPLSKVAPLCASSNLRDVPLSTVEVLLRTDNDDSIPQNHQTRTISTLCLLVEARSWTMNKPPIASSPIWRISLATLHSFLDILVMGNWIPSGVLRPSLGRFRKQSGYPNHFFFNRFSTKWL